MADIIKTDAGYITRNFTPYTLKRNQNIVTRVIKNWRANGFDTNKTNADVDLMIHYPETITCPK